MTQHAKEIYSALVKALYVAAGLVLLFWFFFEIAGILLFFVLSIILAIVLNAPVTWLEERRVPRVAGTLGVFALCVAAMGAMLALMGPRLVGEITKLIEQLPLYLNRAASQLAGVLEGYPLFRDRLVIDFEAAAEWIPSLPVLLGQIGEYSFSVLGVLALLIVLASTVMYAVLNPQPLLELYLQLFPVHLRGNAERAFARASTMVVGWMKANIIVGTLEGVLVWFFLTMMDVPGALVWALLAFFAEMVPRLGPFIMGIPPVIVALLIDPMTAVWVAIFYIVMSEIMGNIVTPKIRASTMDIHPVSILFVMVAMAAGFGVVGLLISPPLTAFIKAYFEEFYVAQHPPDPDHPNRVDRMLRRLVLDRAEPSQNGREVMPRPEETAGSV